MPYSDEEKCDIKSRRVYVKLLLSLSVGYSAALVQAKVALSNGAVGHVIGFVLTYIFLGIPLLYMELIVGQFTARDCLDVWKARRCMSHVGYVVALWQVIILVYNHNTTTFVMHYLLISFENPVPFYKCGAWTTKDCGILVSNYSINQDCIRIKEPEKYCLTLHTTYPEYQYWRNYVLGGSQTEIYVAWRVCIASALVCIIVYLSCFRRIQSVSWVIGIFTVYPITGYVVILLGSMLQKGVVTKYEEALDSRFELFSERVRVSNVIQQTLFALGVGSGVPGNLAGSAPFRAPCYAIAVVTAVVAASFTALAVCTTAMMACPYALEHGITTYTIMNDELLLAFEKLPRLLSEYEHRSFYLILVYSCQVTIGIGTCIVIFFSLIEMAMKRNAKLAKYPGLVSLAGVCLLFLITVPLLGSLGINIMIGAYRRYLHLFSIFVVMIECLIFVFWYGFEKFSEDVHFMQGIQPSIFLKISWMLSSVVLGYVFCNELCFCVKRKKDVSDSVGLYILSIIVGGITFVCVGRILVAVCRKRFLKMLQLDPAWGPKSVVLQRSRALFSTQAMTKEYLYRQDHLQAGVAARQRRANTREQHGE